MYEEANRAPVGGSTYEQTRDLIQRFVPTSQTEQRMKHYPNMLLDWLQLSVH